MKGIRLLKFFRSYKALTLMGFSNRSLGFSYVVILVFMVCLFFGVPLLTATAQVVDIPDPELRAALELALDREAGADITQADMASLKVLEAVESGIRDLMGLEFATNLTGLELRANRISDVSPLKNLTNLTKLRLGANRKISDVSPLKDLTNLKFLDIDSNRISDVSPLKDLPNLTWLDLDDNGISDVSPLKDLSSLTYLDLDGNLLSDVSPLKDLTNLKFLDIDDNYISDISPLSVLINLTVLDIEGNKISDISPLNVLINLMELDIHNNEISDLSPLSTLTNLTVLDIESNKVSDVSPLSTLVNLTELGLHDNEISDLSPLSGLINLKVLDLRDNPISDFSPIAGLIVNLVEYYADTPAKIPDVNRDGVVNILDIILVAAHYHSRDLEELAQMNIYPDVNLDGVVDIKDLVVIAGEIDAVVAAPTLRQKSAETSDLTVENLTQWLALAKGLESQSLDTARGIRVLEDLLVHLMEVVAVPRETALLANYPNPFNPETWIPYQLAESSVVTISIYSADGKLVRELGFGHLPAGIYHSKSRAAYWDGRNMLGESVASGVYFYRFTAGDFTATGKMLIRK